MHAYHGVGIGEEGYGQKRRCRDCALRATVVVDLSVTASDDEPPPLAVGEVDLSAMVVDDEPPPLTVSDSDSEDPDSSVDDSVKRRQSAQTPMSGKKSAQPNKKPAAKSTKKPAMGSLVFIPVFRAKQT